MAASADLGLLQFCNINSYRTNFILGFSLFMGLSVPQYFNNYVVTTGHGPVNTPSFWIPHWVVITSLPERTVVGTGGESSGTSKMISEVQSCIHSLMSFQRTSGVGKTFTKEIMEEMASLNEKPLILALSNPTSQAECTTEEAYIWSEGRAIFASGSPFKPVEHNGKLHIPGQMNNAYIFPGFGFGVIMSGTVRIHDDLLLAASEALGSQVTEENYEKGLIYPPFISIRKISAHIAAKVAVKAYELGIASLIPQPRDLVHYAKHCMYTPVYRSYR